MRPEPSQSPIEAEEARRLFAPLYGYRRLALAVSGGGDSLALLRLASAWAGEDVRRPELTVLTVDHGLRADAAGEAAFVASVAADAGLAQVTLKVESAPPAGGIQAWARVQRYALMEDWCRANDADGIVLAHTAEDQAETLIMRLARGSGVNGLAAMTTEVTLGNCKILRPLLGISGTRLRATLDRLGQAWVDDPANENPDFERVRVRCGLAPGGALNAGGLTTTALVRSASRLGRADAALDHYADQCFAASARLDRAGYGGLEIPQFSAAPEEIRLRILARMISIVRGRHVRSGAALEAALERLEGRASATTIGGCRIARNRSEYLVMREFRDTARMRLEPGDTALWDGRFRVGLDGCAGAEIRALGSKNFTKIRQESPAFSKVPMRAGQTLPGGFDGDRLVAPPDLAMDTETSGTSQRLMVRFSAIV